MLVGVGSDNQTVISGCPSNLLAKGVVKRFPCGQHGNIPPNTALTLAPISVCRGHIKKELREKRNALNAARLWTGTKNTDVYRLRLSKSNVSVQRLALTLAVNVLEGRNIHGSGQMREEKTEEESRIVGGVRYYSGMNLHAKSAE